MPMQADLMQHIAGLKARGEVFCLATVVRTLSVTAAKAGAKAVIRADGHISDGWIGGGCARAAVLKAAREAMADGQPRLVSIVPKDLLSELGIKPGDERDGVRFARNMCPSQGTMDVFVEPMLPRPNLIILGASPVAIALAELAPRFGYRLTVAAAPEDQALFETAEARVEGFTLPSAFEGQSYIVIATQGRGDEAALKAALQVESAYLAFVGSARKVAALRASLAASSLAASPLAEALGLRLARLKGPAGLDLGAISPEEIALSILAEILSLRRSGQRKAGLTAP